MMCHGAFAWCSAVVLTMSSAAHDRPRYVVRHRSREGLTSPGPWCRAPSTSSSGGISESLTGWHLGSVTERTAEVSILDRTAPRGSRRVAHCQHEPAAAEQRLPGLRQDRD